MSGRRFSPAARRRAEPRRELREPRSRSPRRATPRAAAAPPWNESRAFAAVSSDGDPGSHGDTTAQHRDGEDERDRPGRRTRYEYATQLRSPAEIRVEFVGQVDDHDEEGNPNAANRHTLATRAVVRSKLHGRCATRKSKRRANAARACGSKMCSSHPVGAFRAPMRQSRHRPSRRSGGVTSRERRHRSRSPSSSAISRRSTR